jgi:hypothetical protein
MLQILPYFARPKCPNLWVHYSNRQVPFSTFGKVMVQTEDKHAALLIPITVESAPDGNLMLPQCGKLMGQVTQ